VCIYCALFQLGCPESGTKHVLYIYCRRNVSPYVSLFFKKTTFPLFKKKKERGTVKKWRHTKEARVWWIASHIHMHASAPLVSPPPSFSLSVRGRGAVLCCVAWLLSLLFLGNSKMEERERTRLCLDPNFGIPKYTVAFRLYLVIIVQPLTN
jgi:hypothetical protein